MRADYKRNPFQGLSKWMACCIVILELAVCDPRPTYRWEDRQTKAKLLCRQCPPGSYVERHCTKQSETVCAPCPSLHYTGFWNYLEKCLYCSVFCHSLEEEVQPCNGTHNRACQCKPGYHADSDFCVEHTKCAPGTGVARPGNPHEDTKCAPCPEGTFSSTSSSDACQPHQNCSARGQKVNVPGNQFHDTFCTACRQNKSIAIVNGTDESSAIDGCEDAVLDYLPFQIRVPRRLQRLKRLLSNSPPSANCPKGSVEHLQMDLHSFLIRLKSTEGARGVVEKVKEALERMKLEHILSKITKHFLSL